MPVARPDITAEKIIPMLDQGFSVPEIAQKIHCGINTVYVRAKQGGFVFEQGKKPQKKKIKNLCICCGLQPVPKKPLKNGVLLTRLCSNCYHKGNQRAEF